MSAYDTVHAHMLRLRRQEAGQDANEIADALGKVLDVVDLAKETTEAVGHGPACSAQFGAGYRCRCIHPDFRTALTAATEDNGP